jgi:DinB superfamily
VIAPDDKDWTWVLERPCPDCGFDAGTCAEASVADLVRANAQRWLRLAAAGEIRPGRPDPSVWSPLEYACHVRDVYRRYDQRIELMLGEWDPLFPNWDQDASAISERYEEQDALIVADDLDQAAELLATRLDGLSSEEWQRPGRRSDGASFTVGSIARYMIHDPTHHIWDVTKAR